MTFDEITALLKRVPLDYSLAHSTESWADMTYGPVTGFFHMNPTVKEWTPAPSVPRPPILVRQVAVIHKPFVKKVRKVPGPLPLKKTVAAHKNMWAALADDSDSDSDSD